MRRVPVDAVIDCRLRCAFLSPVLWYNPFNLLRYCIPEDTRLGRRWSCPRHWCRRLRQQGGLLLLVLVYSITGCTGAKAPEKAAVTAPSAPEKVITNQVSSSKTKLNASPRSKVRASGTAVKPVAPPRPVPQQQGEVQEGRVF